MRLPIPSPLPPPGPVNFTEPERDAIWINRIVEYARRLREAWRRFDLLSEDLPQSLADLPGEEIEPVFSAFDELVRLGVKFDPRFIFQMRAIADGRHLLDLDGQEDFENELLDWDEEVQGGTFGMPFTAIRKLRQSQPKPPRYRTESAEGK